MKNSLVKNIGTLYNFIQCFETHECVEVQIGLILDAAFSSSEVDTWTTDERADAIFTCRQTQEIIKTVFELSDIITTLHLNFMPFTAEEKKYP